MKTCQAVERLFYFRRYMEKVWKELREGGCQQMWMRNRGTSQEKHAKQSEESHGDPSPIQTTLPASPSTPGRHADTRLSVDVNCEKPGAGSSRQSSTFTGLSGNTHRVTQRGELCRHVIWFCVKSRLGPASRDAEKEWGGKRIQKIDFFSKKWWVEWAQNMILHVYSYKLKALITRLDCRQQK